jgi:hypothetical protein
MQRLFPLFYLFVFFVLFGCNEPENTSAEETDDTVSSTSGMDSSQFRYDPALEPLTVGAAFSKKLADTLGIKMYEFTIKPGDSVALHAHPDHAVYVLQGGKGMISFNGQQPQEMELKAGMGFVSGSVTDAGKNIGTTTIKLVVVDIYRPTAK